jgi:hypothetical protein
VSKGIREHLRSNIVGYIALFCFAMSGTAIALDGSNTVFSDDIVNGEVKAADIGTSEVGPQDILDGGVHGAELSANSVDASKIATGAVGSDEIATDAVDTPEILNNSVRSGDVRNGTLTTDDLGTGSVASDEIADGSVGTPDLADGSVTRSKFAPFAFFGGDLGDAGFGDIELLNNSVQSNEITDGAVGGSDLNIVTRSGPTTTIPDTSGGGPAFVTPAACDSGEKALGGGVTNFGADSVYVTQTYPDPAVAGDTVATGWAASLQNFSGSDQSANAYVICTKTGLTGSKGNRH